ncbi:MAG: FlgD immunoglobulin-like domain containing protein [bacterium]|nr:FlgD immunoglobulin-like domain containing protein [bacterium]
MGLTRILLATATLALIGACNDATPPDETNSDIRGRVVDAQGQPVAGAAVVLQYATTPPMTGKQDKPQTQIEFDLRESGHLSVWISDYCDDSTLRWLADGDYPAGTHAFTWNGLDDEGRILPDGAYQCHVVTDDGERTWTLLLLFQEYGGFAADAAVAPLAVTDGGGRFTLAQACLPFGYVYEVENGLGELVEVFTINRDVQVWAFSEDAGASGSSAVVTVDPETGADITVTLDP